MGRYPAEALDLKFEWMRAKQAKKAAREAQRKIEPRPLVLAPDPPPLPRMLRVPEVARALGVDPKTVRHWFAKRAVTVRARERSVMLIPQRALEEWIREHTPR